MLQATSSLNYFICCAEAFQFPAILQLMVLFSVLLDYCSETLACAYTEVAAYTFL